eukprot:4209874-Prorocentrum_lima.AAC.1
MGEFLRKWIGKRLLQLGNADISRLAVSARQIGVGVTSGAEALAIFHQLIDDAWRDGDITSPLARIK